MISQCSLILLFGFDVSLARADLMGRKQLLTAVRDRTRDAVLEGIEFLQVAPLLFYYCSCSKCWRAPISPNTGQPTRNI